MCKRIVLLLLLVSSAVHAIDFYDSSLEKEKGKMVLLLQDEQGSDLLVLPNDVKKHIVGFMICLIKEKEKLSDKSMQIIFLK